MSRQPFWALQRSRPPSASPLHHSTIWIIVSALHSIKMGNGMGGILSRRKDKTVDDGYHILGLFPCSKLQHNQKVRIRGFTRLCISLNAQKTEAKEVRATQSHCYSLQCHASLTSFFLFILSTLVSKCTTIYHQKHSETQVRFLLLILFIYYFMSQKK